MASTTVPVQAAAATGLKEQFLDAYAREIATTLRVLRAYPAEESELRPAPILKTARELAWMFVMEQGLCMAVLRNEFTIPPSSPPPAPATLAEVIGALEQMSAQLETQVRAIPEEELLSTFRFYVAPRTLGDVPKLQFLWFILSDLIHHRGQFSIYMRIAGGVLPSIYGPTAEEPWY
jgi:uncharacterized damage-inducible protein DinB